ncbi:MAG: type II toxin-antitoxin system CcdA family antitoxin [Campylobacterales bacterium]|nr:type II toxin-antitoxin system CcdA family antitoxin [Campylobacterales bacterium]
MLIAYRTDAPKKATNLSINSELLQEAKALNINLSQSFEAHLADLVAQKRAEQWRVENRESIEKYNEEVSKRGTFSKSLRRF